MCWSFSPSTDDGAQDKWRKEKRMLQLRGRRNDLPWTWPCTGCHRRLASAKYGCTGFCYKHWGVCTVAVLWHIHSVEETPVWFTGDADSSGIYFWQINLVCWLLCGFMWRSSALGRGTGPQNYMYVPNCFICRFWRSILTPWSRFLGFMIGNWSWAMELKCLLNVHGYLRRRTIQTLDVHYIWCINLICTSNYSVWFVWTLHIYIWWSRLSWTVGHEITVYNFHPTC